MQNCFEEIIGIKGACGTVPVPSSGLYLQDLPGVDLKLADAVLQEENSSFEFLRNKIRYATESVIAQINTMLAPFYKTNSILENNLLGQYDEFMQGLPAAAVYRGITVRIDQYPYMQLNISKIALYSSNFTGNTTIKVFDLVTGDEIDSFEIAVVAGQVNYIPVNKKYFTERQRMNIFIAYDATLINTYQSNMFRGRSCVTCHFGGYGTRYAQLNGGQIATGAAKVLANVSFFGYTSGLSIQYTIGCSNDAWVCSMKDQLAFSVLHKTGVVLMDEVINGTRRMNSITTVDKDKAIALKADFDMIYQENIRQVVQNVRFPNDLCFKCTQRVKSVSRIP